MPRPSSFPVDSAEMNWQPYSVLKSSETRPVSPMAFFKAFRHRSVSMVLETAQPSTLREAQSIIAHR